MIYIYLYETQRSGRPLDLYGTYTPLPLTDRYVPKADRTVFQLKSLSKSFVHVRCASVWTNEIGELAHLWLSR